MGSASPVLLLPLLPQVRHLSGATPKLLLLPPPPLLCCVCHCVQIGPDDPHTNALAELATHIGKRDAFYQLRTVEQLG